MAGELRISKGRVLQMVGAATAKLREPKHVRTLRSIVPVWARAISLPEGLDHNAGPSAIPWFQSKLDTQWESTKFFL